MMSCTCVNLIEESAIETIYSISKIDSIDISFDCPEDDVKSCNVSIYNENKNPMNYGYINREYCCNIKLYEMDTYGKVVKHNTFFLREDYRNNGIAYELFEMEKTIYSKNGFREIHLDAIEDGILVWRSLGYKYIDTHTENNIMVRWRDYFFEVFSNIDDLKKIDVSSKSKRFEDIPKKYKVPESRKTFSQWLQEKEYTVAEPMYFSLPHNEGN